MTDTIWVAVIGLISAIGVAIISYVANRKGAREANDANMKLITYRLQELENKVSQHNQIVERTYKLEGRMNEVEHDVRDLKKGA